MTNEVPRLRLEGVEALRGFACMSVLLHHAFASVAVDRNFDRELLWGVFDKGRLGVTVFFVLSGFVIAMSNPKDGRSLREMGIYLLRRFSRIFPVYWLAFLVVLSLYWKFAPDALGPVTLSRVVSNWFLISFSGDTIVPGAWTLVFEITFYVLFLVMLVSRKVGGMMWVALSLVVAGFWFSGEKPASDLLRHLTSPYMLQFMAGMLVYELSRRWRASLSTGRWLVCSGLGMMIITACMETALGADWGGGSNFQHMFFASVMLVGLLAVPAEDPAFRTRAGSWILMAGRYSYSIYLFHIPCQKIVVKAGVRLFGQDAGLPAVWLVLAIMIIASTAAGILVGRYVEMPVLEWFKRSISRLGKSSADFQAT